MSHSEHKNLPENQDLLMWLSIDEEGLELLKNQRGSEFIEKNKEVILREQKIESFILNILKDDEPCPEELLKTTLGNIKNDKTYLVRIKEYLIQNRKLILPLCAMIFIGLSIFILGFLYPYKHTYYKEVSKHKIFLQDTNIEKKKDETKIKFADILLSSSDRNLSNSDSETIQNKINSKISNVSINIKDFLNTNNDYQLVGYAEDELEGNQIIQIVFDYKGDTVKVLVFPYSPTGIDLIKPAIENGTIKNIKKIENYFISVLGKATTNMDLFQYITSTVETKTSLEEYDDSDDEIITTPSSNPIENVEDNSYSSTQILNIDGAISNESVSSEIYDTVISDTLSPI